jgi:hypothetical protein
MAAASLFPCAGGIGWVDAAGRIIACDIDGKSAAEVFAVPFPVMDPPLIQGELLVLQNKSSDRLLVYDLAARGVKFESRNLGAERVLGAGPEGMVLLDGDRPVVRLWEKPTDVLRAQDADEEFFNCHFSPGRILVMGRNRLFVFWIKGRRFESLPLPRPAASPFLCDGEAIFYGSRQRSLVKFPLQGDRSGWELRLGQVLNRQPLSFAGTIVASPNDQNVLQVNRRGTILWWQALGSTLNHDLLPMSGHLAAVLLNREIRFFDPRRRQATGSRISGRPVGAPLAFRGSLFFMTQDGQAHRLQRLGSRFGIQIELEPASVRWVNRSLRFTLSFYNLPAPSWECVIRDAEGRQVFQKSMAEAGPVKAGQFGPVVLAWVPLQAGTYTIRVRVVSLGRDWQGEAPVKVLDPLQVAPAFYLHL